MSVHVKKTKILNETITFYTKLPKLNKTKQIQTVLKILEFRLSLLTSNLIVDRTNFTNFILFLYFKFHLLIKQSMKHLKQLSML